MINSAIIFNFILNAIIVLFTLSILIIVHEFGHFIMAKRMGVRVEKFSLGFGPQLLKRKKRDTEYSISAVPLGGYVKLAGDNLEEYKGKSYEYFSQSPGRRFQIIFFGPLLNYVLGFLIFCIIFFMGYPSFTTKIDSLIEGFGAQEAGLKVGDEIVSVDGKKVIFWEELQNIIHKKKISDKVKLLVIRDNKEFSADVLIKEKEVEDDTGKIHKIGLIGISPYVEYAKGDFVRSFILGLHSTGNLTVAIFNALWNMVSGKLSVQESVTGPIGIFVITSKVVSLGLVALLHLIAVLSLSLAIFNLLPLPVLDGGHILLLGLEKIRGKALGLKAERFIARIGLTFIITLAILVTYNDLARFFGDKIGKWLVR